VHSTDTKPPEKRKQLHAALARYIDPRAFTSGKVDAETAEKLKFRRKIANDRAKAVLRFFAKPDNLAWLNRYVMYDRKAEPQEQAND
jgi:hypothetical protein